MPAGLSLKEFGLRIDDLDCPAGGAHHVAEQAVMNAAKVGGGTAACLKCRQTITLEKR